MKANRQRHAGYALLEALMAILVFSLGLLGIIGFQASAMKIATESQMRTNASMLADELIANMSVSKYADLATDFGPTGSKYKAWYDNRLVGSAKLPNPAAAVVISSGSTTTTMRVLVCIDWQAPGEKDHGGVMPSASCARDDSPTTPWKFQTQAFLF